MIKLDTKNLKILVGLDSDPLCTTKTLAHQVRLSSQGTEQRIKNMLSNHTIYGFFTVINCGLLGYELFRVHIKANAVPSEKYIEFAKSVFHDHSVFWIAFISGSFDIIIDIWARNSHSFQLTFDDILKKHGHMIQNYEIIPMLHLEMYSYNYFEKKTDSIKRIGAIFNPKSTIQIDNVDFALLQIVKSDFRMSYSQIGQKCGLTRNAVKYRLNQLRSSGIISGHHMMVNFRDFGRLSYKIFVSYDHTNKKQEQELIEFIRMYPGIIAHAKLLGKWHLDIEIQPHSAQELQNFVIELRQRFSIIKEYELVQIIEDFGLDFFSANLNVS